VWTPASLNDTQVAVPLAAQRATNCYDAMGTGCLTADQILRLAGAGREDTAAVSP
jgi:hypothetical protein